MASLITDILKEVTAIPSGISGWSSLATNYIDNAQDAAVDWLLSTVYDNVWARSAYKGIMIYTSARARAAATGNSNRLLGIPVPKDLQASMQRSAPIQEIGTFSQVPISWIGSIIMSPIQAIQTGIIQGMELGADRNNLDSKGSFQTAQLAFERVLASPNIAGVPIGTASITTSRDVDISEQLVIVQKNLKLGVVPGNASIDGGSKVYKTDNAVPRLKTWHIDGYLTANLEMDQYFALKPSLDFQTGFLDRSAKSRKPVLFKTSRGEFVFVQITNLTLTEEASYNNAIKISIDLKEYNPYVVPDYMDVIEMAKKLEG